VVNDLVRSPLAIYYLDTLFSPSLSQQTRKVLAGFPRRSVLGFRFDGGGGFVVVGFGLVRGSGWEAGGRKLVA